MKIEKVEKISIRCADEKGNEYTITGFIPYEKHEHLDGFELVEKLGTYFWNGTKVSGPRDDVFYIPQIDTKVKKIS